MSEKNKTVSLKNVAEYCNVSLMTVSRAFRKDSIIKPETRAKILDAAEKLNYRCGTRRGRPQSDEKRKPNTQIQLIFCHIIHCVKHLWSRTIIYRKVYRLKFFRITFLNILVQNI